MTAPIQPIDVVPCRRPAGRLDRRASGGFRQLWHAWRQRRELRRLSELDDRMLRDIGLSRGDVERALARPFWHAAHAERRPQRRRGPA